MKKSLYKINEDYINVLNDIEENQGDITEANEVALKISEEEMQVKSVGYVNYIKSMVNDNKAIDDEIKRLQDLKKSNTNKIDLLKHNLKTAMQIFGIPEIKTPLIKINFRQSKSIVVNDVDLLPETCKTTKVSVVADKKAIKALIESGKEIKGAEQVINNNIQIK